MKQGICKRELGFGLQKNFLYTVDVEVECKDIVRFRFSKDGCGPQKDWEIVYSPLQVTPLHKDGRPYSQQAVIPEPTHNCLWWTLREINLQDWWILCAKITHKFPFLWQLLACYISLIWAFAITTAAHL